MLEVHTVTANTIALSPFLEFTYELLLFKNNTIKLSVLGNLSVLFIKDVFIVPANSRKKLKGKIKDLVNIELIRILL